MSTLKILGAQEHNLKNIDVEILKNELAVFTGVSGSGKSSLVFHTIYAEAFRRFIDATQAPIFLMGNSVWSKLSRPKFRSITGLPPALGLSQRQGVASKTSTVGTISGLSDLFRVYYAAFADIYCGKCDIPLRATDFNSLEETILSQFKDQKLSIIAIIAEKRKGGFSKEIEKFKDLGFSKLRINEKLYDLQSENVAFKIDAKKLNTIEVIIDHLAISSDKLARIKRALAQALEYGKGILKVENNKSFTIFNTTSSCPQCGESAPKLDPRYFSHSSIGQCTSCKGTGSLHDSLPCDLYPCKSCLGTRLEKGRPIARILNKTFEEIQLLNLTKLNQFVTEKISPFSKNNPAKLKVLNEIERLLKTMTQLNLGHFILNRGGSSLSPGDLQRIRLSSMISNKLSGALYIADEPCQGLTQQEVVNLSNMFKNMIAQNASIIAIEHHPTFLNQCDTVYTMGPGAGVHGGEIVSIEKNKKLIPEKKNLPIQKNIKASILNSFIYSNIKYRNLEIPKIQIIPGQINILRGSSGTGKSSFVDLCLLPSLIQLGGKYDDDLIEEQIEFKNFCQFTHPENAKALTIDDVKPGSMKRVSRRIVAAALDVLSSLRVLFSKLPQSQVMGLSESHFSWNSKLGRCENCEGRGYLEIPQKYAPPVRVECEICIGSKLNSRSLIPRFKGYNFADLMNLTLDQASDLLQNHHVLQTKIQRACQFGLGYILLGQGIETISGGEIQRLTLSLELKRANLIGSWFILRHPSTGLHKPDIEILGSLMNQMIQKGATFVAIENREEFLKFSQNCIDFDNFH